MSFGQSSFSPFSSLGSWAAILSCSCLHSASDARNHGLGVYHPPTAPLAVAWPAGHAVRAALRLHCRRTFLGFRQFAGDSCDGEQPIRRSRVGCTAAVLNCRRRSIPNFHLNHRSVTEFTASFTFAPPYQHHPRLLEAGALDSLPRIRVEPCLSRY